MPDDPFDDMYHGASVTIKSLIGQLNTRDFPNLLDSLNNDNLPIGDTLVELNGVRHTLIRLLEEFAIYERCAGMASMKRRG